MLSETQIRQFRQDGYLVVENVIDTTTLDAVQAEYAGLLDGLYEGWQRQGLLPVPDPGWSFWERLDRIRAAGLEWFQPMDISLPHDGITEDTPMHFGPAVFDLLTHRRILDIVETLIGGEITSNPIQHVRIKPPQREVPGDEARAHIVSTAWHQDQGVTLEEADETDFVTVWIAVTDANVRNGCLQLIPNPPAEMLPHCPQGQTAIAPGHLDASRAVAAEIGAGGIILIDPYTPHSAGPNRSDGYRWSFDIRYNVIGQPTGRPQFPDFVARSRAAPETELKDWRMWLQSWRDARHHLANTAHRPQHRWPADAPFCA
ncbi:phytanoyl-CoA dioxygenase family protein [Ruegeria sp. 2205SS24-7]|uniref:phytanoyl-CoA dioxygenase family protein n=1 Tax=Ruegeria discodermiae TaxID=3064389 RepID=UPI0027429DD3|nr:phytanoyl-CoA dioxygenase family protein [Ruegeria sp. 2205SS24-7]MDP5217996.1 phytanoyl-CoA dioxygenase family protein [Ruegeria sp. 2205SS24-7]